MGASLALALEPLGLDVALVDATRDSMWAGIGGFRAGRGVYEARVAMGRELARQHPVEADMVMPSPESGTPAAIRLPRKPAAVSGVPAGSVIIAGPEMVPPGRRWRSLAFSRRIAA